jgi:hypothetical protein
MAVLTFYRRYYIIYTVCIRFQTGNATATHYMFLMLEFYKFAAVTKRDRPTKLVLPRSGIDELGHETLDF